MTVVIPRSLGWAPRRVLVTLRYSVFLVINHAGFQYANLRFNPTYAYDVDPTLGSTAMPGFTEWGSIYRYYRCRSSTCHVTFANAETFNMLTYVCPVNYDPTANVTPIVFLTSSLLCKKKTIGPLTGNGICTLTKSYSTAAFAGVQDHQVLDGYCAPFSGSAPPSNSWFWAVGIFGTANLVNGVAADIDIISEYECFELASPAG